MNTCICETTHVFTLLMDINEKWRILHEALNQKLIVSRSFLNLSEFSIASDDKLESKPRI